MSRQTVRAVEQHIGLSYVPHLKAQPPCRANSQEFGLSSAIGPVNVGVLAAGGSDDGGLGVLMKDGGSMARLVEREVKVGGVFVFHVHNVFCGCLGMRCVA